MKIHVSCFLMFLGTLFAFSQKVTHKTFDDDLVAFMQIDCDQCFRINLENTKQDRIEIQMAVEGEYNEQVILLTESNLDSLKISTAFQPIFKAPDDKLAAHKALSIVLHVKVPNDKVVSVRSDLASIMVRGQYHKLRVELKQGHFDGWLHRPNITVHTLQGDINLVTDQGNTHLISKNGSVSKETLGAGSNDIELRTINGNIRLRKTEE